MLERPDGVKIGAFFIAAILAVSIASRMLRAFELRVTQVRLDATTERFLRDCARRNIRLVANEPEARDRAEYSQKLRQIVADNDLPDASDVIFVEVTVTDPSDFASVLDVRGEVHGEFRVISRLHRPQRSGSAPPPHPRRHRRTAPHLLRVERRQPGR